MRCRGVVAMASWMRSAVALIALGVATAGCGGGGSSHSDATGAQPPATTGAAGSPAADAGFDWSRYGPADPGDPPPYRWYGSLERHDCKGLSDSLQGDDTQPLWTALSAVCLAVVDGDDSQWPVASTAAREFARTGPSDGANGCMGKQARALLQRALDWHSKHPRARPVVRFPEAGRRTACPFRIEKVQIVDEQGSAVAGPLQGRIGG